MPSIIEDQLCCAICSRSSNRLRKSSCGHSFCQPCYQLRMVQHHYKMICLSCENNKASQNSNILLAEKRRHFVDEEEPSKNKKSRYKLPKCLASSSNYCTQLLCSKKCMIKMQTFTEVDLGKITDMKKELTTEIDELSSQITRFNKEKLKCQKLEEMEPHLKKKLEKNEKFLKNLTVLETAVKESHSREQLSEERVKVEALFKENNLSYELPMMTILESNEITIKELEKGNYYVIKMKTGFYDIAEIIIKVINGKKMITFGIWSNFQKFLPLNYKVFDFFAFVDEKYVYLPIEEDDPIYDDFPQVEPICWKVESYNKNEVRLFNNKFEVHPVAIDLISLLNTVGCTDITDESFSKIMTEDKFFDKKLYIRLTSQAHYELRKPFGYLERGICIEQ